MYVLLVFVQMYSTSKRNSSFSKIRICFLLALSLSLTPMANPVSYHWCAMSSIIVSDML